MAYFFEPRGMFLIMNHEFTHALLREREKIHLGNQIRHMRTERGWSHRELAKRAGLDWKAVWRLENGGSWKRLTTTVLFKIAVAFGEAASVKFTPVSESLCRPLEFPLPCKRTP